MFASRFHRACLLAAVPVVIGWEIVARREAEHVTDAASISNANAGGAPATPTTDASRTEGPEASHPLVTDEPLPLR